MTETLCNLCGLTCALPNGPCDDLVMDDHGLIACEVMVEPRALGEVRAYGVRC